MCNTCIVYLNDLITLQRHLEPNFFFNEWFHLRVLASGSGSIIFPTNFKLIVDHRTLSWPIISEMFTNEPHTSAIRRHCSVRRYACWYFRYFSDRPQQWHRRVTRANPWCGGGCWWHFQAPSVFHGVCPAVHQSAQLHGSFHHSRFVSKYTCVLFFDITIPLEYIFPCL